MKEITLREFVETRLLTLKLSPFWWWVFVVVVLAR